MNLWFVAADVNRFWILKQRFAYLRIFGDVNNYRPRFPRFRDVKRFSDNICDLVTVF